MHFLCTRKHFGCRESAKKFAYIMKKYYLCNVLKFQNAKSDYKRLKTRQIHETKIYKV